MWKKLIENEEIDSRIHQEMTHDTYVCVCVYVYAFAQKKAAQKKSSNHKIDGIYYP